MDDENVGADGESGLGATLGEEELWRQRGEEEGRQVPAWGWGGGGRAAVLKHTLWGGWPGRRGGKSWETWETSARMKSLFGEEDMGEGGIYLFIYALFKAVPSA